MILTINLDPVEALPKLYDAVDGITRMVMDAKDNVNNPETKAARETIVTNALKMLGAEPQNSEGSKKKLTPREFALAALDFVKPLMKLDPERTVNALHQLYTLEEGEKDTLPKALTALTKSVMQKDVQDFLSSLADLNGLSFGTTSAEPTSSISAPTA
jgi:hypothetical protein|nr:MAG TPA: hypothetical protein [Caudoviricetes sp.]